MRRKRRARKRQPQTDNAFLLDNAEMLYDSMYRIDRKDRGCGGGSQKAKHNLDGGGTFIHEDGTTD